jgi:predicted HicB family RNase H-like nuclease
MNIQSDLLSYKGYVGSAEISHEDECLVGQVLYVDDLIMYDGGTYSELKKAFEDSVDDYLELCAKVGKSPNKAYSGSFNVRIGPDLHSKAARAAADAGITLNDFVRSAVANSVASIGLTRGDEPAGPHYWSVAATNVSAAYAAVEKFAPIHFLTIDGLLSTPAYEEKPPISPVQNVVVDLYKTKLTKVA